MPGLNEKTNLQEHFEALVTKPRGLLSREERHTIALARNVQDTYRAVVQCEQSIKVLTDKLIGLHKNHSAAKKLLAASMEEA